MPISEILDGYWAENTAVMNHSNNTTHVHGAGVNSLEQTGNKNVINGYAGLDSNGLISSNELPLSIFPFGVSVAGFIPYIDDALTYLNLVYIENGYCIAFDDVSEKFTMEKL
jgi:hypothetical protein